jgi:hypothetical protein
MAHSDRAVAGAGHARENSRNDLPLPLPTSPVSFRTPLPCHSERLSRVIPNAVRNLHLASKAGSGGKSERDPSSHALVGMTKGVGHAPLGMTASGDRPFKIFRNRIHIPDPTGPASARRCRFRARDGHGRPRAFNDQTPRERFGAGPTRRKKTRGIPSSWSFSNSTRRFRWWAPGSSVR